MTFEEWFKGLDIHKIDPFTEVENEFQIEVFLRLAWEEGFAEGYDRCEGGSC
tara:strand:+ start:289 stop:444 length:156 start_codon:yes stop_codon:yes gene_type:complete